MNPQSNPTPEQQPVVPMAEIPQVVEGAAPASAPIVTANPVAPTTAPVNPSLPTATPGAPAGPVTTASVNPALAGDVDVIEKEWVDQAEAIIAKTVGDPHAEEEAIEDLQIDYMKKRYGKDVAKSGDQ